MGKKNKKNSGDNKSSNASGNDRTNRAIITDSRFASVHSDPRFQNVPQRQTKVEIDSRFSRMFTDKRFASSSAPLDKRGKPKKKSSQKENPLRHYYRLQAEESKAVENSDSDEEETDEKEEEKILENKSSVKVDESDSSDDDAENGDDVDVSDEEESESTTDTDEDENILMEVDEDDVREEEEQIPTIEKETNRLAVVNMDWRNVKAVDLFVLLTSFLPKEGKIMSVAVYPSEFGLKRMEEEAAHGPVGLFDDEKEKGNDSESDDDEIDPEKLRAYEKSKLRYYYAVVNCDSVATANYIYEACDGLEIEFSSNKLDLRFIPASMEFKHPPRDVATEAPSNYKCLDFYTRELQHSRVDLTWDEDEPERTKTLKRKFNADQIDEMEFKGFIASDESESDDSGDDDENNDGMKDENKKHNKLDKYRALISGNASDEEGEDNDQDMEVTFNTSLEGLSKRILEKKDKKSETVWEAYLRKRKEKKKARKNKSKDSSDEDDSDSDDHGPIDEPDDFFVEEPSVKKSKKDSGGKSHKKETNDEEIDGEGEASRAELELLLADDKATDTHLKGYKIKPKKSKGKRGKEIVDEDKIPTADLDDPRFSALFGSHHFALDPTDPQFKRSAAYVRQLAQKQQKGDQQVSLSAAPAKMPKEADLPSDDHPELHKKEAAKSKDKYEISSVVKSLKMKSKQVPLASKNKMSQKPPSHDAADKIEDYELSNMVRSVKKKAKSLQK